MIRTAFTSLLAGLALAACQSTPAHEAPLKPGTDWVANDPGWAQEAEAVFEDATDYVETVAETRQEHSWAVILDLDETVLNNVEYQVRLDRAGETYSPESWYAWTQEKAATLVPGAKPFIETVNELGGFVAFVTNRADTEQLATEENLDALGLERNEDFRVLMTKATPDGVANKTARYALVPPLLAVQGYPDVDVVAYLGDNEGDKPDELGEAAFFCIDQGAMYGDPCAAVPGPGQ